MQVYRLDHPARRRPGAFAPRQSADVDDGAAFVLDRSRAEAGLVRLVEQAFAEHPRRRWRKGGRSSFVCPPQMSVCCPQHFRLMRLEPMLVPVERVHVLRQRLG